ncbi:hypothetical protein TrCOL_g8096 [Triparma columacea]|uniref:Uncharacterized protein n=1 Tax=Triparma columacea TaxID=722753 RepID=A0A9W7LB72_9STRA|nr:hypothetical protein TrCOL_g8096 [Triparma columacea]
MEGTRARYALVLSAFLIVVLFLSKSDHLLNVYYKQGLIFGHSEGAQLRGNDTVSVNDSNDSESPTLDDDGLPVNDGEGVDDSGSKDEDEDNVAIARLQSFLNTPVFEPFEEGSVSKECIGNETSYAKSMKSRTAIVLSGKYTGGHLKFTLESISRAFDTDDIEVFIYALYSTDEELEDMERLFDSRPWIVSVLFERWSDDLHAEIVSEVMSNNEVKGVKKTYPPCCVAGCCNVGFQECKEKMEKCKIENPDGYPAITWSLVRGWRLSMSIWERYVVKVRKGNPHRIMLRARLDSVFPTVDRDVDWGGEAADYIHSADEVADIWVPWGGRDFLANSPPKRPPFTDFEIKILTDAGASPTMHLQDKVVIGKPMAIAKVFKEIGLHIGDHEWRTDEFAEAMFWEALSKLGFAEAKVGRFTWTVATVRSIGRTSTDTHTSEDVYFHYNCLRRRDKEKNSAGFPGMQIKNLNLYGFPSYNFTCSCRKEFQLPSSHPQKRKGQRQTNLDITNDLDCMDKPEVANELKATEDIVYPQVSGLRFCGPFMKVRHHNNKVESPYVPFISANPLSDWP